MYYDAKTLYHSSMLYTDDSRASSSSTRPDLFLSISLAYLVSVLSSPRTRVFAQSKSTSVLLRSEKSVEMYLREVLSAADLDNHHQRLTQNAKRSW